MDTITAIGAALSYFFALGFVIPGLASKNKIQTKVVFIFASLALLLHAWQLKELILNTAGQNLSILNVASLISFIISLVMSASMLKFRVWFILPVVYSFSAMNLLAATFLPGAFITHLETHPSLLIHISLALFAYSTLMIATLYALQLAWLDHKLKSKKSLMLNPNLPPLMMVERQLFKIILVGLLLLTLTLMTGFTFLQDMFAQGKAHKAILSFIAWIIYATLTWGHYQRGWRGQKALWFSLSGAFLLTLAYFGSRFVQEIVLT
ncbi:inner membrane protein YpjD [Aliivibrio fischeri]|uniref:cytochrome C assembly family protein n=1 Tax=Aliivibrio fischeri TaxID=668 RepID=UPI0012DA7907|nr:inner membrane protein YpjD [Aliivibrio fischeri]MUJ29554.1 inner membrane protein YpjD [Aliivibrio fischeri]